MSVQEQELNIQISLFDEHEVTCSCRLGHEPIYIIIVCNQNDNLFWKVIISFVLTRQSHDSLLCMYMFMSIGR